MHFNSVWDPPTFNSKFRRITHIFGNPLHQFVVIININGTILFIYFCSCFFFNLLIHFLSLFLLLLPLSFSLLGLFYLLFNMYALAAICFINLVFFILLILFVDLNYFLSTANIALNKYK